MERRFAKEDHSFVLRRLLDLRRRAPVENHRADAVRKVEQFRDRGAAVEAGAVALQAPRPFVERLVAIVARVEARLDEEWVLVLHFVLALRTDAPDQPL